MSRPHDASPVAGPAGHGPDRTDHSDAIPVTPASAAPPNRAAVWALLVAVVGLLIGLTVLGATISFVVGVIGLAVAVVAVRQAGAMPPDHPGRRLGMSWAAMILSTFAILMSVFFYLTLWWLQQIGDVADCVYLPTHQERQVCLEEELTSGR